MRKQKRQDYSDILEAGKTIAKSSALNRNKPKKKTNEKELSQKTKDSLQNKAREMNKSFYSIKHKVYVDGEDGVLSQPPVKPENYEKL